MKAAAPFGGPVLRVLFLCAAFAGFDPGRLSAATPEATEKIVTSANALLATLDASQRSKASFAFDDQAQRKRWSNLPISMAERRGLRMGDLKENQRDAAMQLLAATLSKMGYEK